MSGHTKWSEIKHKTDALPDAEERQAAARADLEARIKRFDLTLAQLRKARQFTQQQLAGELDVTQSRVAKIERGAELYLSTLERYVTALGGELELRVSFDDGAEPVTLDLADLTGRGDRSDEAEAREPAAAAG